jgi:hypothetical protein
MCYIIRTIIPEHPNGLVSAFEIILQIGKQTVFLFFFFLCFFLFLFVSFVSLFLFVMMANKFST